MLYIKTQWGWARYCFEPYCPPAVAEPELYSGPLPSFEAKSFIKGMEHEHAEWVKRRAAMQGDHDGKNPPEGASKTQSSP